MPLWNKDNPDKYNAWRREYRKKQTEKKKCNRCYRPLIEDHYAKQCVNCADELVQNKRLRRNFNGDN